MQNLGERSARAAAARFMGLGARGVLRIGSLVVLARLLDPDDFGLVAMITVLSGAFEILATAGLAAATVQRAQITDEHVSTLFWFNVGVGVLLTFACLAAAPSVGRFYSDPRAAGILMAIAPAFLINSAGVQHLALLQRDLRYGTLSSIEVVAEALGVALAIALALAGWGYWALVAGALATPVAMTIGAWLCQRWKPGRPRFDAEVAAMLWFGGTITTNNLVVHGAYNLEKVLLGRYFGPQALGYYGRAYELVQLPTQLINSAVGRVAFSGLSRLQSEPTRFRRYFLKSYTLVISITLPVTLFMAALSGEIVYLALGPKWQASAELLRLLAPAILVFGIINPLAWPLQAYGLQRRSLYLGLALAPIVIGSYLIGIPYGPKGVATACSTALLLWLVPHVLWCLHRTPISWRDFFGATMRPLAAAIAAALAAFWCREVSAPHMGEILRLLLAGLVMAAVYAWILLILMQQKTFYFDVVRSLLRSSGVAGAAGAEGSS